MSDQQVVTTNPVSNSSTNDDKTSKMIYIYQNLFVSSLLTVLNLNLSITEKNKDKIPADKEKSFTTLTSTSKDILNKYKSDENNKDSDVDQIRVIKKAFKVLSKNYELVKNHNPDLFVIRNDSGKITTIIPGINISLIVPFLNDDDSKTLWDSIDSMFVTSVKMVYMMTDKTRHDKNVVQLVSELEQKSLKKLNNFFMGLNLTNPDGQINMDQLMASDITIPGTEANSGFLGSLGVDKLLDVDNLTNEIKKFNDDDINETINTLTGMLGNDSDIKDVCSTMVKSVLEDIKSNGIENMFSIAERVSGQLTSKIDPQKMAKTANGMNELLKNNSDKFKDLTDQSGNPVGANFLKQFQSTLNMANMFKKK